MSRFTKTWKQMKNVNYLVGHSQKIFTDPFDDDYSS